ncbi:MAG: SWIM zinc finger family protein [Deltaproteobacteria bacterium]|nr:SWIM zinc finger family protein [Deltaproteobacteria bacterium]
MSGASPRPRLRPFLFDQDRLSALASEQVILRGIGYFREQRVLSLGWDEGRLWAEVEGSVRGRNYLVDVALDEEREPLVACTCPFDLEPACKHVVAALLLYAARVSEVAHDTAAAQAVELRRQRARAEVAVRHVAGDPTFGTWLAHTISNAGAKLRPHRVHIRSTRERITACSCPDFASNRLGTCEHIEAVLHRLAKKRLTAVEPRQPVVYLAWGASPSRHRRRWARWPCASSTRHAILCAQGLSRAAEVPGELAASLFDQARVHVRRSLVA